MEEMTMARLNNYSILAAQKQRIEAEYNMPSYISGVDTSKPAVQSGKISDITADIAIMQLNIPPGIKAEYERIIKELKELDKFIYSIPNETTKAMAIRRFIMNEKFKNIAAALHCSKSTVYRTFKNFENWDK